MHDLTRCGLCDVIAHHEPVYRSPLRQLHDDILEIVPCVEMLSELVTESSVWVVCAGLSSMFSRLFWKR